MEKRSSFVTMLIRAIEKRANRSLTASKNLTFADVSSKDTFRAEIEKACGLKILVSCEQTNSLFRPNDSISRFEALNLVVKAFEKLSNEIVLDSNDTFAFEDVTKESSPMTFSTIMKAKKKGLTSGVQENGRTYFFKDRPVQRGDAVNFIEKLILNLGK